MQMKLQNFLLQILRPKVKFSISTEHDSRCLIYSESQQADVWSTLYLPEWEEVWKQRTRWHTARGWSWQRICAWSIPAEHNKSAYL